MDLSLWERLMKAVANKRRLAILLLLKRERMLPVTDIARAIHMSVPATSKHLQILRNAGILIDRKRGLSVLYRISLEQEEVIRALLKSI